MEALIIQAEQAATEALAGKDAAQREAHQALVELQSVKHSINQIETLNELQQKCVEVFQTEQKKIAADKKARELLEKLDRARTDSILVAQRVGNMSSTEGLLDLIDLTGSPVKEVNDEEENDQPDLAIYKLNEFSECSTPCTKTSEHQDAAGHMRHNGKGNTFYHHLAPDLHKVMALQKVDHFKTDELPDLKLRGCRDLSQGLVKCFSHLDARGNAKFWGRSGGAEYTLHTQLHRVREKEIFVLTIKKGGEIITAKETQDNCSCLTFKIGTSQSLTFVSVWKCFKWTKQAKIDSNALLSHMHNQLHYGRPTGPYARIMLRFYKEQKSLKNQTTKENLCKFFAQNDGQVIQDEIKACCPPLVKFVYANSQVKSRPFETTELVNAVNQYDADDTVDDAAVEALASIARCARARTHTHTQS